MRHWRRDRRCGALDRRLVDGSTSRRWSRRRSRSGIVDDCTEDHRLVVERPEAVPTPPRLRRADLRRRKLQRWLHRPIQRGRCRAGWKDSGTDLFQLTVGFDAATELRQFAHESMPNWMRDQQHPCHSPPRWTSGRSVRTSQNRKLSYPPFQSSPRDTPNSRWVRMMTFSARNGSARTCEPGLLFFETPVCCARRDECPS